MIAAPPENTFTRDRVDAFQEKFGMRHVYLAMHAAFPLTLTPDLLYLLRDNFNHDGRGLYLDIPLEAVSDLLLSELCQDIGLEVYRMDGELRQHLLARLEKMPRFGQQRIADLSEFMAQYYGPALHSQSLDQKALAEAQLWAAQLQSQPEKALQFLSQQLAQAQSLNDEGTQLRLHYLLDYFPGLEGEVAQLRTYAKGNALKMMGLEDAAKEAFEGLGVTTPFAEIGGVEFELLGAGEEMQQEQETRSSFAVLKFFARVREIQQQLRWLGLYDGALDGEWLSIADILDAFEKGLRTNIDKLKFAHAYIAKSRKAVGGRLRVYMENMHEPYSFLSPVLEMWGIQPTMPFPPQPDRQMTQQRPPLNQDIEVYDDEAVAQAHLVILGVDRWWFDSERFHHVVPLVRRLEKPVVPIILEESRWHDSVLSNYETWPSNSPSLESAPDIEAAIAEIQLEVARQLRVAFEEMDARQSEEGETAQFTEKIKEIQQQLRWLGEYDGFLDGDWAKIASFYPDLEGKGMEECLVIAEQRNREKVSEAGEITVYVENVGPLIEVFQPVLEFWRVKVIEGESLYGFWEESLFNPYDIRLSTIDQTDLLLIGVDQQSIGSSNSNAVQIIRKAISIGKVVLPIIMEACDWQKTPLRDLPILTYIENEFDRRFDKDYKDRPYHFSLGRALRTVQYKREHPEESSNEKESLLHSQIQKIIDDMVFVEGGTFKMGSEIGAADEKPVHKVTLSDFQIQKYQVTQLQWEAVMGSNFSHYTKGHDVEHHPADNVTFDFCNLFISKLNMLTQLNFRLPSEAEWEFAAKGGRISRAYKSSMRALRYSGSDNLDEVGWYRENAEGTTHPVGRKNANELGLYDMTGNVWEICHDWYDPNYYESSPEFDPKGPKVGTQVVVRGGSIESIQTTCYVSSRKQIFPEVGRADLGFRLAMDAPKEPKSPPRKAIKK